MNITLLSRDSDCYSSFREMAINVMKMLREIMQGHLKDMFSIVTGISSELVFTYLGQSFLIRCEFPPNSKALDVAQISTYVYYSEAKPNRDHLKLVFYYTLDRLGNINRMYSIDDFAEAYIEEFVEHAKAILLNSSTPLIIR